VARFSKASVQFLLLLVLCGGSIAAQVQSSSTDAVLTVTGSIEKPLLLSIADLQHLPRTTIKVLNSHEGKEETYEGVLLGELLKDAGIPQGEKLRGATMATYLLVQGGDGYRVILSLAETDDSIQDSQIVVADKMNGQPLGPSLGPLRLVVPHDRRPARWVRMLQSIKVVTVPK
jgi:DMSO/TMAO reductase YedYZ molybdopterin-dependent catalytic subunit